MEGLVIVSLSVVAIILSLLTSVFSILAYGEVLGLKKSTHKIQYVPVDGPTGEALVDNMRKAFYPEDESV